MIQDLSLQPPAPDQGREGLRRLAVLKGPSPHVRRRDGGFLHVVRGVFGVRPAVVFPPLPKNPDILDILLAEVVNKLLESHVSPR